MTVADVRLAQASARDHLAHGVWPGLALALAICQALTAGALLAWMTLRETVHVPVAVDAAGRAVRIAGEDDAGADMEEDAMLSWTVTTVTQALDIGFDDWQARIKSVRDAFTEAGFQAYERVLGRSLVLERLRKQRQVVSAVAQGAPVVTRLRRLPDGRTGYEVEFPLLLTFYAGEGAKADERLAVRALVVRMSRAERFAGLAIADFLMTAKGEGRR